MHANPAGTHFQTFLTINLQVFRARGAATCSSAEEHETRRASQGVEDGSASRKSGCNAHGYPAVAFDPCAELYAVTEHRCVGVELVIAGPMIIVPVVVDRVVRDRALHPARTSTRCPVVVSVTCTKSGAATRHYTHRRINLWPLLYAVLCDRVVRHQRRLALAHRTGRLGRKRRANPDRKPDCQDAPHEHQTWQRVPHGSQEPCRIHQHYQPVISRLVHSWKPQTQNCAIHRRRGPLCTRAANRSDAAF